MLYRVGRPQRNQSIQQFIQLRAGMFELGSSGLVLLGRPADTEPGQ
jgi:hypothetical protein